MTQYTNTFEEFVKLWNESEGDVERWHLVIDNQHLGFTVFLDNDMTWISFEDREDDGEVFSLYFNSYIGWSDGVFYLLDAMNIKCEIV